MSKTKKKRSLYLLALSPSLAIALWSMTIVQGQYANAAGGESDEIPTCKVAKNLFFQDSKVDVTVDCNAKYLLFLGDQSKKIAPETTSNSAPNSAANSAVGKKSKDFKMGGFNLYHLGDDQSTFKNYATVAEIINQSDIVGGTEFRSLTLSQQDFNKKMAAGIVALQSASTKIAEIKDADQQRKALDTLTKKLNPNNYTVEQLRTQFIAPGYIRLLKVLQELDPSWSLIIAATATGEDAYLEISGYYFRSSVVSLKKSEYCDGAYGCLGVLTDPKMDAMVARRPFLASFQVGGFDFSMFVTHVRSRQPGPEVLADIKTNLFPKGTLKGGNADILARYAELTAIVEMMKKVRETGEKDVILVGDTNLPYGADTRADWKIVTKSYEGLETYVDQQTSISHLNGYASAYDHFLLDPTTVSECSTASATRFDFISAYNIDDLSKVSRERFESEITGQIGISKAGFGPRVNVKDELTEYDTRVIQSRAKLPYKAYIELLSDHVPVFMGCTATEKDDD